MADYDTPETKLIVTEAVHRIHRIADAHLASATDDQRKALNEIRDIVNDELKRYADAAHDAIMAAARDPR